VNETTYVQPIQQQGVGVVLSFNLNQQVSLYQLQQSKTALDLVLQFFGFLGGAVTATKILLALFDFIGKQCECKCLIRARAKAQACRRRLFCGRDDCPDRPFKMQEPNAKLEHLQMQLV
jgi:hypothetical protein